MCSTLRNVWFLAIVGAASAAAAACGGGSSGPAVAPIGAGAIPAPAATPATKVEMTVKGGFAYVYDNQQLEIAFLKRTAFKCDPSVTNAVRIGTVLTVTSGTIS